MQRITSTTWVPIGLFILTGGFLVGMWHSAESHEKDKFRLQLRTMAEQVGHRLAGFLESRFQVIGQMKRELVARGEVTQDVFESLAGGLHAGFSGFHAISWVDAEGYLTFMVPPPPNGRNSPFDLRELASEAPSLAAASRTGQLTVTSPITYGDAGRGFTVYCPVRRGGELLGNIQGVFRLQPLIDECLQRGSRAHFFFEFHDGEDAIGLFGNPAQSGDSERASHDFPIGNRTWTVTAFGRPGLGEVAGTWHAEGLLAIGLVLALFLAGLTRVYLLRQQALRLTSERYRTIVENAPEAIVVLDADEGRFVDTNEEAARMFGRSREELLRVGPLELSPERQPCGSPSRDLARARVEEALSGSTPEFEWMHVDAGGREFPTEVRLVRLPSAGARLVRGSVTDISARKAAEDALRLSEERYRRIVDTAQEGVWVLDAAGRTTFANRRMAEMLGRGVEEMLGREMTDFVPDGAVDIGLCAGRGVAEQVEIEFERRDGTRVSAMLTANELIDGEGRSLGALAMVSDITERKNLEAQLRHAQKMEAVGRLAGGVAHDFNNLLTSILGYSELLAGRLEGDPESRQLIDEVRRSGERAANLTRQLLAFSRKQVLQPEPIDLGEIIRSTKTMLDRLIREDIELSTVIPQDVGFVLADPGQIEQVVLNLAVNARDAMPDGGQLTIEARSVTADEKLLSEYPTLQAGDYVVLSVRDSGCGIPDNIRDKIFEPFFTTKRVGRGTGLGLSMVHGIVSQSGGHVFVDSGQGVGSAFHVYLPRVPGSPEVPVEQRPREDAAPGTGTVLIVEDEEAVREVARLCLLDAGYDVLAANGPEDAIRIAENHSGPISVLLTDMVMPAMSGREVADRIARLRPQTPTIFMSGYAETAIGSHGVDRNVRFLTKPFTRGSLIRAVHEVIAATA